MIQVQVSGTKHVRLVPPFNKDEVDKFFSLFEKIATCLKWPQRVWAILVHSVLQGKAQKINSSLSLNNSTDYDAGNMLSMMISN